MESLPGFQKKQVKRESLNSHAEEGKNFVNPFPTIVYWPTQIVQKDKSQKREKNERKWVFDKLVWKG